MNRLQRSIAPAFTTFGVLHLVQPMPFDAIVPPQLPGSRRFYSYVSGVAELAVAGLLTVPRTRATGGAAAAALLVAVWPANFYMTWVLRHQPWYVQLITIARLPLQIPLIRAAWGIYSKKS